MTGICRIVTKIQVNPKDIFEQQNEMRKVRNIKFETITTFKLEISGCYNADLILTTNALKITLPARV